MSEFVLEGKWMATSAYGIVRTFKARGAPKAP